MSIEYDKVSLKSKLKMILDNCKIFKKLILDIYYFIIELYKPL